MKKIITQIRDIQHIESELRASTVGVLALYIKDEEIVQLATTFLYQDKNIYFFIENNDDIFGNLKYETSVNFTVVKNENLNKNSKQDFTPVYKILSISVAGLIKKVDDDKLLDTLKESYLKKYSLYETIDEMPSKINKVIFIDTEEIQAFEEMGG
jgi:nitroimidazol reductase NimA-like FMN-containing flavoprotein (pyridoxamine 5'-phosphate oxidase superfamily)